MDRSRNTVDYSFFVSPTISWYQDDRLYSSKFRSVVDNLTSWRNLNVAFLPWGELICKSGDKIIDEKLSTIMIILPENPFHGRVFVYFLVVFASSWSLVHAATGVFRIGGVFPLTSSTGLVNPSGVQKMDAVRMAISDFNTLFSSSKNMTVKLAVRDSVTTYSTTVVSTYTLIKQAFSANGGVRAIVGGDSDDPAKAVGEVVQDFDLPVMSYGSPTTDLSHGTQFPNSVRAYPSDSFQAAALVDLLRAFGWSRVFVVQSLDTFGSDAFAEFEHAATPYNINIVYKVAVEQSKLAAHDSKAAAAEFEAIKGQ